MKKQKVLANITEGLTATQSEKVVELAEGIEEEDIELYAKKVDVIKKNYFPSKQEVQQISEEIDVEQEEQQENVLSEQMQMYTRAIAKNFR
jgi:energy-converting hydrogenase A subunit M